MSYTSTLVPRDPPRAALRLGDVTGTWTDELWVQVDAFTVTQLVGPSSHAVYCKLDACSRSEAVVRARSTGQLDEG
jgi:hypothetical protein